MREKFRTDASKMAVLFTTSSTNGYKALELISASSALRDADVNVLTIGIGSSINSAELKKIALDPTYFVRVNKPDELDGSVTIINTLIAKVNGKMHHFSLGTFVREICGRIGFS